MSKEIRFVSNNALNLHHFRNKIMVGYLEFKERRENLTPSSDN